MKIQWVYRKEDWRDKKNKAHVNHLWYISTIDDINVDFGFESEVFRTDDGPIQVSFYKGEIGRNPNKVKTQTYKTLPLAKKAAQKWIVNGFWKYLKHLHSMHKAISSLSCK